MSAIFFACLGLGLAAYLVRFVALFQRNLNARAFCGQIRKLVEAGNRSRALKLCAAVPKASISRIVAPMLKAMEATQPGEAITDAYRKASRQETQRLGAGSYQSYAAALLGAAALAIPTGELALARQVSLVFPLALVCAATLQIWLAKRQMATLLAEGEAMHSALRERAGAG